MTMKETRLVFHKYCHSRLHCLQLSNRVGEVERISQLQVHAHACMGGWVVGGTHAFLDSLVRISLPSEAAPSCIFKHLGRG